MRCFKASISGLILIAQTTLIAHTTGPAAVLARTSSSAGPAANRFIRWVTASDLLALSLLQARLIDLGMPIKIVEGT
jgi:hypothetical protein